MRYLVTITDNIGQTNMPFHEFACYRHVHFKEEYQVVFVMGNENNDSQIPEGLDVRHVGTNLSVIRRETEKVIAEAKSCNATIVFHIHEAKSVIRLFLCKGLKLKRNTIFTIHSTYSGYPVKNKILAYLASLLANLVTCVSETSYEHYPESLKRIKKDKIVFIQNGVDIERIDRTIVDDGEKQKDSGSLLTLVYTARLIPLKAHKRLLQLVSHLPEYRLMLFGDGPLREFLKEMCKEYQIDNRVYFEGVRSREDVYSALKKADAYITTSTLEGLPISLLEAMACSLPSFASDIEQHKEVKAKCPSLKCFSNDEELIEALQAYAGFSKETRLRLGSIIRKEVVENFSLRVMHDAYSAAYKMIEKR